MKLSFATAVLLLSLSVTFAAAQAGEAVPKPAAHPKLATHHDEITANEALLMKQDSDFNSATQARRLDGWMEFMADDVVARRGPNVVGREALRKSMETEWADPNYSLTWRPVGARMVAGEHMGFTWGRWELNTTLPNGAKLHMTGDYLTVWERQKDGSWKVIWDGGGADTPGKPK